MFPPLVIGVRVANSCCKLLQQICPYIIRGARHISTGGKGIAPKDGRFVLVVLHSLDHLIGYICYQEKEGIFEFFLSVEYTFLNTFDEDRKDVLWRSITAIILNKLLHGTD